MAIAVPWPLANIVDNPLLKNEKSKFAGKMFLVAYISMNHRAESSIVFITVGTLLLSVFRKVTLTKHIRSLLFDKNAKVASIRKEL